MSVLQVKRGLEGDRLGYTPLIGEMLYTTDTKRLYIGDGITLGGVGSGGSVETGMVMTASNGVISAGFLECNGATLSRSTYSSLFSAIGTIYGAGDGSTTFRIPDLRGEFIRGVDSGRGVDIGRNIGTFQADDFKAHSHKFIGGGFQNGGASGAYGDGGSYNQDTTVVGAADTRPRNIAMMFVIKY